MTSSNRPFNPLAPESSDEVVGARIVGEILKVAPKKLDLIDSDSFEGAGIYVLYTQAKTGLYAPWGIGNPTPKGEWVNPLYVGKATPKGGRTGGARIDEGPGRSLHRRLREHADSIRKAKGADLNINDFWYRRLVLKAWWVPLGEDLLIRKFTPLWNDVLCGFGNHAVGSTRATQQKSSWDVLHEGRKTAASGTEAVLEAKLRQIWRDRVMDRAPVPYTEAMLVNPAGTTGGDTRAPAEQLGLESILGDQEKRKVSR